MSFHLLIVYALGFIAMALGVIGMYMVSVRKHYQAIPRWILLIMGALTVYIPLAQVFKYRALHFYVDFSHWAQVLYQITKHGIPLSPNAHFLVPGLQNYFAAHFVPFIYVLALPFKLLPYPETIMVFSFLFMASAVIPLYKLALLLGHGRRFALLVSVVLLWYPTFQYITLYEFEMLRFAIPVLLWMLYFYERRRMAWCFLFALCACLIREEVGLTIMMFGLYVVFWRKERAYGTALATLGVGMFLVITGVIMPYFSSATVFEHVGIMEGFAQWGSTPVDIMRSVLTHPIAVARVVFSPLKIANLVMLMAPLLFVPLMVPAALVGALATLGIGFVSTSTLHLSYFLYYIAPAIPFIFYAFLKAWPRCLERLSRYRGYTDAACMNALCVGVLICAVWFGPSPFSLQFYFHELSPAPFKTQDFHWTTYRVTAHHRLVNRFIVQIPDDAIVSTQEFFHPRLFKKKGAMVFPKLDADGGAVHADYILLDLSNNGLSAHSIVTQRASARDIEDIQNSTDWKLVDSADSYVLYQRL